MKYYVLTTSKFAKECIEFNKYGSTNSNWLSNINIGDTVFVSQFNYNNQTVFGPFKVILSLFYDKKIIFPGKRYYYRIGLERAGLQCIKETDLYLNGLNSEKKDFALRFICLLQQNKHLHSICLNDDEGKFLSDTLKKYGASIEPLDNKDYAPEYNKLKVDEEFIISKNKLYKKLAFSSESDLESYIIFCLKNKQNLTYESLNRILSAYPKNELDHSFIYNQFIFGNAYPSDIVILNENNTNILELKKTGLDKAMLSTIEKEITKYCTYSLHSDRIETKLPQINFFLLVLKAKDNANFKKYLQTYFQKTLNTFSCPEKYTFTLVEYYIENQSLLFRKI